MLNRRYFQIAGTIAANPWFYFFRSRAIYGGKLKGVCFPGMNCYACPLAVYSCPIGALQQSFAEFSVNMFLYAVGTLGLIGAAVGRMPCGWICPFGFLQDLLFKIPLPKFRLPTWARYGKYATLAVLVIALPALTDAHWFSRLCPVGTLEANLFVHFVPPQWLNIKTGNFFWMKVAILAVFLLWMMVTKRPFCRTACPLGAIFSLFNPFSLYRMQVDGSKCKKCGICRKVCPVDIDISLNPNSPECLRCLDCKKACPTRAVSSGFRPLRQREGGTLAG